jgi:microcystin degradation protein MlrC
MRGPRIAVLGFSLESNGFAPVAVRADFEAIYLFSGAALEADIRSPNPRANGTLIGFAEGMDSSGRWEMVPIVCAQASPAGPVDQAFFDELVAQMRAQLSSAGRIDGVYIAEHGAAAATVDPDPDGTLFSMVREVVGAAVPVIATLDLHANVSARMVEKTDLLVAFLTNPHVDQRERGREAARAMRELLAGLKTAKAFVKLPLMPPSVTLLTNEGPGPRPYGDLIRRGQAAIDGAVMNVSISAGFYLTDSVKSGMSVVVTTRGDGARARSLAAELARAAWADRKRYVPSLVSVEDATRRMVAVSRDASLPALCFADTADNPGGGGRGNTTDILRAFIDAGVRGVAFGIFNDPSLAAEAHRQGKGARFSALFNRDEDHVLSKKLAADVEVVSLSDGTFVGRRAANRGRTMTLGPSARLRIGGEGGIDVVVISIRQQITDPAVLEHFGIDVAKLRGVVVKSRGHFRAAFGEFFRDDQILEVDAPGLTTQGLHNLPYRNIPRPMYPLDPDAQWHPPEFA